MRPDVGEPVSSLSGNCAKDRCGSPSFPGCPHVPLPRSQIPVRPPRTWPAPREGGDLLCAWRCWPPWGQQEVPDDVSAFEIQSRGFDTCSIRFTHPLRVCCAMFASERLPTFLGWECLPTGHRLHVSSSFRWFPHVLVAGARPPRTDRSTRRPREEGHISQLLQSRLQTNILFSVP